MSEHNSRVYDFTVLAPKDFKKPERHRINRNSKIRYLRPIRTWALKVEWLKRPLCTSNMTVINSAMRVKGHYWSYTGHCTLTRDSDTIVVDTDATAEPILSTMTHNQVTKFLAKTIVQNVCTSRMFKD